MIFYLLLIHLFSCEKISITILGTNDIHGRVFAIKKNKIKIGGLSLFSSFLNILR
jgi:2',3'-cyclic-nucleotide 2'-phosphodiesterase (5'-nucleotidase family)